MRSQAQIIIILIILLVISQIILLWQLVNKTIIEGTEEISSSDSFSVSSNGFWARANIHTHSNNSADAKNPPQEVANYYKNMGYNVLSITDHNPSAGYKNFTECEQFNDLVNGFICVHSEELTTGIGHAIFINIENGWENAGGSLINYQDAIDNVTVQGGFSILAHPNWGSVAVWSDDELLALKNYTGIEIYNSLITRMSPGQRYSMDKWDVLLKAGRKVFGFATDDRHNLSSEVEFAWIKVYMEDLSKEEFVDKVKKGYFYASSGPSMDEQPFELYCDGLQVYRMGEEANCPYISINAKVSPSSGYSIQNISLIKDGVILFSKIDCFPLQDCVFDYSEDVNSSGYYRLQAIDTNGKRLWSNPIWLNIHSLKFEGYGDYLRINNGSLIINDVFNLYNNWSFDN